MRLASNYSINFKALQMPLNVKAHDETNNKPETINKYTSDQPSGILKISTPLTTAPLSPC